MLDKLTNSELNEIYCNNSTCKTIDNHLALLFLFAISMIQKQISTIFLHFVSLHQMIQTNTIYTKSKFAKTKLWPPMGKNWPVNLQIATS